MTHCSNVPETEGFPRMLDIQCQKQDHLGETQMVGYLNQSLIQSQLMFIIPNPGPLYVG